MVSCGAKAAAAGVVLMGLPTWFLLSLVVLFVRWVCGRERMCERGVMGLFLVDYLDPDGRAVGTEAYMD